MTCTIRPIRSTYEAHPLPLPLTPIDKALREATNAGFAAGEHTGYIAGWWWGATCGGCAGLLCGALLTIGAAWLGRWVAGGG